MPNYHGIYVFFWAVFPALIFLLIFLAIKSPVQNALITNYLPKSILLMGQDEIIYSIRELGNNLGNLESIISLEILTSNEAKSLYFDYLIFRYSCLAFICVLSLGLAINFGNRLSLRFDARRSVEKILRFIFFTFSTVAVVTTFGIILSLIFETVRFFSHVSFFEFLMITKYIIF